MRLNSIASGMSAAFWSLTFLLIGCSFVVAAAGDHRLTRVFLAAMAVYALLGMVYGAWAARNAAARSKIG